MASALDSEEVGSSRISTFGSCAMARAIATICRSASDSSLICGVEADVEPHAVGDFARLAANAARIEEQLRAGAVQPVERQIGRHVERQHHAVIDVLMHGHNAGAHRIGRRFGCKGLALKRDRAAVARIDAADDAARGWICRRRWRPSAPSLRPHAGRG